jgi:hypothetical protein
MSTNINELTVEELEQLIRKTVHETMDEYLEDLEALSSESFRTSIKEARNEYKEGEHSTLEDVANE